MDYDYLQDRLKETMLVHRASLAQRLADARRKSAGGTHGQETRLIEDIERSAAVCNRRNRQRPSIRYASDLPILEKKESILEHLRDRSVIVVAGETGSGKSTQLPKIALEAGYGVRGLIGHTQPRRIAARSIANRLSEELGVTLGNEVGFKIRFQDKTNVRSYIKLMTDGILLAETQRDRDLNQYELLILDEAHERSLNIDFLLGYIWQLIQKRPELRVVITSATIDVERFAEHFADAKGPAPIVEVSGRTYPVDVHYQPPCLEDDSDQDEIDGIVQAAHELASIDRGDILVFLPTERDIREAARRLRGERFAGDGVRQTEVLPLYARLSAAEQNRIFHPGDYRRIILATNVAESSLTVPNIRYVIDTGTARVNRYSPRSKVQRLPIESISQASADQRKGRCGRVAPGICVRLYSHDDYLSRDQFTTPEIRRTNLASVILQAKTLRLGELDEIRFLDPPRPESVRDGYKTLYEIGAVNDRREITPLGRKIAKFPVDPRIARMLLAAIEENCLAEMLVIASALEIQDPRERPHDRQQQADEQHAQFLNEESDFLSYLNIWDHYHQLRETTSRSQLRKACQRSYLSYNRLREWTEIHRQLLAMAQNVDRRQRIPPRREKLDFGAVHRALLTGLLSGVAYKTGDREYTGAGGLTLTLWPGSGLVRKRPKWIMAAELLETSRRFARTAARISPRWLESVAGHLLKRSYSDPHWSRKAATVKAYRKTSLMGMPVALREPVNYGPIDPTVSRKVFIEEALVQRAEELREPVVQHNVRVRREIEQMGAKTRRRDLVLDDYSVSAFYEERIPPEVYDVASLRRWIRKDAATRDRLLRMTPEDFIDTDSVAQLDSSFPSHLRIGETELPVHYNFQVGDEDDGVTLTVPAAALRQLDDQRLEWLVPGLLEEKVVALIRSLPKQLRRNFVPVPDTAGDMVQRLTFGEGPLLTRLAEQLSNYAEEPIRPNDFNLEKLPVHLRMNVRVLDEQGEVQATGRDFNQLQQQTGPTEQTSYGQEHHQWNRSGLKSWDFEQLPEKVTFSHNGVQVRAFPTLLDRGDHVDLLLSESKAWAKRQSARAMRRLLVLQHAKPIRGQVRWLPEIDAITLWAHQAMTKDQLWSCIMDLIAQRVIDSARPIPRDSQQWESLSEKIVERIGMATQEVAPLLPKLFKSYHQAALAIEELRADRYGEARVDMNRQLRDLIDYERIPEVPWFYLQEFPRYLNAVGYRIEKLKSGNQQKDQEYQALIQHLLDRYEQQREANQQLREYDPELEEYRWMIEELRVSLFAQPLGTVIKISPQRLDKQWAKVGK